MPITHYKDGSISIEGSAGIEVYRLAQLAGALRLQEKGIRMSSRMPQATTIARKQYGLKGSLPKLLAQVEALLAKAKQACVIIEDAP